jgi:hypothetical protein
LLLQSLSVDLVSMLELSFFAGRRCDGVTRSCWLDAKLDEVLT